MALKYKERNKLLLQNDSKTGLKITDRETEIRFWLFF